MKRPIRSPSSKTTERPTPPTRSAGHWPPADRALAVQGSWDWLAFARHPRVIPELLHAIRPVLLVGLTILLVGLSTALACWSTRPTRQKADGINLLADAGSSNLNNTSAEAHQPERAPHSESPKPVVSVVEPVAPAPMPVASKPPELPMPPVPIEAPRPMEPAVVLISAPAAPADLIEEIAIRVSHRGDTPMLQEWRTLGLQTLLAGALVAATVHADPVDGPVNDKKESSDVKKEDAVSEQLKALRKQISDLDGGVRALSGAIEKDVKDIRKDLDRISNDVLASKDKADKAQVGVESLRSELDRLRKELEALRTQVSSARVSNYPQQSAATGRVRLINTFSTPMTVVLNGKAYEVMPGETRFSEALPAGTINYEVLGVQTARNTKLDANETLTINIFTR